jgi:hypothetical protein
MENKWKNVTQETSCDSGDFLHKLKVEGGYLYRNIWISRGIENVSIAFVPVKICPFCHADLVYQCYSCKPEEELRRDHICTKDDVHG